LFFSFPSTPHAAAATLITQTWNIPSLVRFIFLLIVPFFFFFWVWRGIREKRSSPFPFCQRERRGGKERRGGTLEGLAVFIAF
jgi:hypothetical protein